MSNDQSIVEFNAELAGSNSVNKALKDAGAKDQRDAIKLMPFENLVILADFNVRTHNAARETRVRAIADDMKLNGYMATQPMEVFIDDVGRVIVAEGHTRYDALILARSEGSTNLDWIPTIPMKAGTSMLDLTVNLVKANDKEKLDALGMSIVSKRLTSTFGKTTAEAAVLIGVSAKYITQMLLLAGAPTRLREMISTGIASATLVIEMMEEHGAEEALRLLERKSRVQKIFETRLLSSKHCLLFNSLNSFFRLTWKI